MTAICLELNELVFINLEFSEQRDRRNMQSTGNFSDRCTGRTGFAGFNLSEHAFAHTGHIKKLIKAEASILSYTPKIVRNCIN